VMFVRWSSRLRRIRRRTETDKDGHRTFSKVGQLRLAGCFRACRRGWDHRTLRTEQRSDREC
jgi:hypothetical protein